MPYMVQIIGKSVFSTEHEPQISPKISKTITVLKEVANSNIEVVKLCVWVWAKYFVLIWQNLICKGWVDPEGAGIKHYLISSVIDGQEASLAQTKIFDPKSPLELNLATGVHYISVTIEDLWGAKTIFPLPEPVVVDPINPSDFEDFMNSGKLEELVGTGDTGTLLMVLQAQAQVRVFDWELGVFTFSTS